MTTAKKRRKMSASPKGVRGKNVRQKKVVK
jgi:hypothetical protein